MLNFSSDGTPTVDVYNAPSPRSIGCRSWKCLFQNYQRSEKTSKIRSQIWIEGICSPDSMYSVWYFNRLNWNLCIF